MIRMRGRLTGALAALAAVLLLTGTALAQDTENGAAEDVAEDAAAAPAPVDPALLQACGAERCLEIGFSSELQQALSGAGGATPDQLAEGLAFDYQGTEPLRIYFVAARYDNDRLVRYQVSPAVTVEPGAVEIPGMAEALKGALAPRTERRMRAAVLDPETGPGHPDLPAEAFVGSMPTNTLMGVLRPDLEEPLDAAARAGLGSVAVLAVIPRNQDMREIPAGKSIGAALRLHYE